MNTGTYGAILQDGVALVYMNLCLKVNSVDVLKKLLIHAIIRNNNGRTTMLCSTISRRSNAIPELIMPIWAVADEIFINVFRHYRRHDGGGV